VFSKPYNSYFMTCPEKWRLRPLLPYRFQTIANLGWKVYWVSYLSKALVESHLQTVRKRKKRRYSITRRPTEDLKVVLNSLGSGLPILFRAFPRQMSSLVTKSLLKTGHFIGHVGHFYHRTVQVRPKALK
jgi:hypothetical protein